MLYRIKTSIARKKTLSECQKNVKLPRDSDLLIKVKKGKKHASSSIPVTKNEHQHNNLFQMLQIDNAETKESNSKHLGTTLELKDKEVNKNRALDAIENAENEWTSTNSAIKPSNLVQKKCIEKDESTKNATLERFNENITDFLTDEKSEIREINRKILQIIKSLSLQCSRRLEHCNHMLGRNIN